jgi:hypothetical protein
VKFEAREEGRVEIECGKCAIQSRRSEIEMGGYVCNSRQRKWGHGAMGPWGHGVWSRSKFQGESRIKIEANPV